MKKIDPEELKYLRSTTRLKLYQYLILRIKLNKIINSNNNNNELLDLCKLEEKEYDYRLRLFERELVGMYLDSGDDKSLEDYSKRILKKEIEKERKLVRR